MDQATKRFVPFEEAGEGVTLLFNFKDCKTLQNHLGDGWFNGAPERIDRYDTEWIERYLLVGGKKDGKAHPIKLEELENVTMAEIATKILDALFLSVHGLGFADYQIKIMKAIADAQAKGETLENPPNDPKTSSTSSSDTPSGSVSTPQS